MDLDAYFMCHYDATNYAASLTCVLYLLHQSLQSFVQKCFALPVEAFNNQYAISKLEARTAHLTNALIMSLRA
jgi:hypothetical protein